MPPPRLCVLTLVCAFMALPPARGAAAATFELGMADQHARMFSDPRFVGLGFKHARVVAPYDVVCHPSDQQYYLDVWLAAAARVGARPLVGFTSSWREGRRWTLPSYRAYLRCFRSFRFRYPQVRDFNPWNEPNHSSQATFRHPKKAAGFYNAMRRACRTCNVAAGDLLDWHNLVTWFRRYRPWLRGRPRLWAMHNYLDVNRRVPWRRSGTRTFLRLTRGRVWITESAGVVHSRRYNRYNERRAAEATRRMFRFASRSPRTTRLYAYHWQAACDPDLWDSAWFRSNGSSRPAYRVLLRELVRHHGFDPAAAARLDPPPGPAIYDSCTDEDGG
jgi:hypothetical protein